jgi:polyphosphate kinase 2 (PPK2 family)
MLLKTSTIIAPWTVVEGNFKWFARVKCLATIVKSLSRELKYKPSDALPG